jgi:hypothetical protein
MRLMVGSDFRGLRVQAEDPFNGCFSLSARVYGSQEVS